MDSIKKLNRQEFEEKVMDFIRIDLGCDIREGDELLRYDNDQCGSYIWILAIDKDDLSET